MKRRTFLNSMIGTGIGTLLLKNKPIIAHQNLAKTFVLVHGAWSGGWCWKRLNLLLKNSGHEVSSPTCTGVGERFHLNSTTVTLNTWIQDVINHIEQEDLSQIILVGSGFGGVVISGVADQIPEKLKKLVYLDALVIPNGESAFDQFSPDIIAERLELVKREGQGVNIPAPSAETFGLTKPEDITWVNRKLKPQPLKTYTDKLILNNPIGNNIPKIYLDCIAPPFKPLVDIKQRLKVEIDWERWDSLNTCHDAMISNPKLLQEVLETL